MKCQDYWRNTQNLCFLHISLPLGLHYVTFLISDPKSTHFASSYLDLASIHCLLVELFADAEVDLGGAHAGGRLDVELLAILADLHLRGRGRRHGYLPQHGVHAWTDTTQTGLTQTGGVNLTNTAWATPCTGPHHFTSIRVTGFTMFLAYLWQSSLS